MRRYGLLMLTALALVTVFAGTADAGGFEGGGKTASQAPLIAYGQHYFANLTNNSSEANFVDDHGDGLHYEVALWKLPPLSTHDEITVNWHGTPFGPAGEERGFPYSLYLFQGINDSNWGEALEQATERYSLSGSGTAATEITVRNSDATSSYLLFVVHAGTASNSQNVESFQYDFTVEAPRHYLSVSLGPVQKVATNGFLHATATLATGLPAPDGYPFTLTGTWSGGGVFTTSAASVGGQITFPLALAETAIGKDAEFVVSSAATPEYQAAVSPKLYVEVTKPPAPPAPPKPPNLCPAATNKAHALARRYKRQLRNAERLRGRHRRLALRKVRATEREFIAARATKKADC